MALIELTNVIENAQGIRTNAGAPAAGTDAVQTLTLANITGGTFKLGLGTLQTAAITWSATTNTLIGNIDSALETMLGTTVTTADSTLSGGNGDLTVTFTGTNAKKVMPLLSLAHNALTGAGATITFATTTPGVDATARSAGIGTLLEDTTNGILYQTSTANPPTWGKVGVQS